ncbi:carboxypeptidase-like regulatory domain-containing protein [Malonomonas rubra]|uniref:carboxypeptidase-like regulatory domain-containing protein n=1 Tax=Malonomonas rubra TaxID=57040 RepID=UPI0026E9D024|nr:carboxypeptidase-like regulatory domain-containing protein [Malonomonas rubra]
MKLITVFFCCLLLTLAGCNEPKTDSSTDQAKLINVKGVVVAPLEQTYLYIYKQGMDLYGPAYARSEATGRDGAFQLNLPEGDYIAVARKRQEGETAGPVLAGDFRSDFMQLKVREGMAELTLVAPKKIGDERRLTDVATSGTTGLEGLITDADGNPVADARVQVYDHVQMSERPKFVSSKTGPDGHYKILLPEGGTYYLCARNKFGGPPKLGDLYGRYDQGTIEPSAVVVRLGEIVQDVNITVNKVW